MSKEVGKLGDVITITSGFAFESSLFSNDTGIPLVRIRDVERGYSITRYTGKYDNQYVVKDGDLLVSMDGDFNVAPWRGGKALLNQRVCRIEPIQGKSHGPYLRHVLPKELRRIEDATPFVTVKHLSIKTIRDISIPLPPLSEQRRVAAILDKSDAIRRKREEGIRLTEDLLRSTFLDMFGDPINFPAVPLAEIAEVVSGVTKGRKLTGQVVTVPYLRVANVQDGFLDLGEIKTIDARPGEVQALALQPGDIVMTEGGDHDKLGRGGIWPGTISNCIHQNHVFRVRVNQKHILPIYFAEFLKTLQAKMYFLRCAKKTTNLASINMTQLRGLPVPVPPLSQQRIFEKAIITTKTMVDNRKNATSEATHLFDSLVQRAFRGQLSGKRDE